MNSFFISTANPNQVVVEDYTPTQTHRGWDEIRATVAGRMNMDALRREYEPGKFHSRGRGFVVMDVSPKAAPAGWSRATVSLQGLFNYKKWGEHTAEPLRRTLANVRIKTGASTWTQYANVSTMEAVPGYRCTVFDATPPNLKALTKTASVPYAGLAFPAITQSDNPWSFDPAYDEEPTRNEPHGWVLADYPAVEEIGGARKLYRKELLWLFVWEQTPGGS